MNRKPPPGLTLHQQAQWYGDEAARHRRLAERWATVSIVLAGLACALIVTAAVMMAIG